MYSSIEIANCFLERARRDGRALTPMQLLKLVYIAHGWSLGLYQRPLVEDQIQAWKYGPVIPRLYNRIRRYGSNPVTEPLLNNGCVDLTVEEQHLIDEVYRIYGKRSGIALSQITHAKGTPWTQSYQPGTFNVPISNDLIQAHYEGLIERAKAQ